MHHRLLAALEAMMIDNHLIVHPVAAIPVSHHFALMLTRRGWLLYLAIQVEADLAMET